MKLVKLLIMTMIFSNISYARHAIRELRTSDKVIKPIYLSLGRSTVLKFRDTPEKIVIGNKNYFNLEYINNDVTIQPLANFDTNLFVYTKGKKTYSFLLKVVASNKYDDVVHVRWKSSFAPIRKLKKKRNQVLLPSKTFLFGKDSQFHITGFYRTSIKGNYVLHLSLKNLSSNVIDSNLFKVFATRGSKRLNTQKLFYLDEKIKGRSSTKARLFLGISQNKGVSINVEFQGEKKKFIIGRKYL